MLFFLGTSHFTLYVYGSSLESILQNNSYALKKSNYDVAGSLWPCAACVLGRAEQCHAQRIQSTSQAVGLSCHDLAAKCDRKVFLLIKKACLLIYCNKYLAGRSKMTQELSPLEEFLEFTEDAKLPSSCPRVFHLLWERR